MQEYRNHKQACGKAQGVHHTICEKRLPEETDQLRQEQQVNRK